MALPGRGGRDDLGSPLTGDQGGGSSMGSFPLPFTCFHTMRKVSS